MFRSSNSFLAVGLSLLSLSAAVGAQESSAPTVAVALPSTTFPNTLVIGVRRDLPKVTVDPKDVDADVRALSRYHQPEGGGGRGFGRAGGGDGGGGLAPTAYPTDDNGNYRGPTRVYVVGLPPDGPAKATVYTNCYTQQTVVVVGPK